MDDLNEAREVKELKEIVSKLWGETFVFKGIHAEQDLENGWILIKIKGHCK